MNTKHIPSNLEKLARNRRILLLQGPIGFFFRDLARWLEAGGARVFKFNFNYGDQKFYPAATPRTHAYQGRRKDFAADLTRFVEREGIEAVVCFGDTRSYHRMAKQVCLDLGLSFWAFEEGYFRPHFVTLEEGGVNAYSPLPRRGDFFRAAYPQLRRQKYTVPQTVPDGFLPRAKLAAAYYVALHLGHRHYPAYQHHRSSWLGHYIKLWGLSGLKRANYALRDYRFARQVAAGAFGRFFVLPLQVFNDSQIHVHSDFPSVGDVLRHVLASFAAHAPADVRLLVKHHPMDRGFIDYRKVINAFLKQHPHVRGRVFYVHDVPLPVFLRHGIGMVTLNSTSGLSALIHNMPVKVLGRAHYDIPGMTSQQDLADFWCDPQPPDAELFHAYRMYHLNVTQINGNFYSRVNLPPHPAA